MKKENSNVTTIFINLVSSFIFQIILVLISSSGLVYALQEIRTALKNDVTVSVSMIIFLMICSSLVTISIFLIVIYKKKRYNGFNRAVKKIRDYYFVDYEKKITIYKNGHGIILHKFKVVVNDINKISKIRRKLNIEDGMKTSNFPSLSEMMKTDKHDRFSEFGFWYESESNIVSRVTETYWDSESDKENKKAKNNPKEIRWVFDINRKHIKAKEPFEISYAISVPGLAALEDGMLNKSLLSDEPDDKSFSTMHINHRIRHLKYVISFEEGVQLETIPVCKCIMEDQDGIKELDIQGKEYYDLLYKKFVFEIDNPPFGSNIRVMWKYNILED